MYIQLTTFSSYPKDTYHILLIITLLASRTSVSASVYRQVLQQYDAVPHQDLPADLHVLILDYNSISFLNDSEFSPYVNLTELHIKRNNIEYVSPSAFVNTSLEILDLSRNLLTTLPDVLAVADTLTKLFLEYNLISEVSEPLLHLPHISTINLIKNLLTTLPNFTFTGTEALQTALVISIANPFAFTTLCHFEEVNLKISPHQYVPSLDCAETESEMDTLNLVSLNYNTKTDFSNLTTFNTYGQLRKLIIENCDFSEDFPDLPQDIRQSLIYLSIRNSLLSHISPQRLANYSLNTLNLRGNELSEPSWELFQIAKHFYLQLNPFEKVS